MSLPLKSMWHSEDEFNRDIGSKRVIAWLFSLKNVVYFDKSLFKYSEPSTDQYVYCAILAPGQRFFIPDNKEPIHSMLKLTGEYHKGSSNDQRRKYVSFDIHKG